MKKLNLYFQTSLITLCILATSSCEKDETKPQSNGTNNSSNTPNNQLDCSSSNLSQLKSSLNDKTFYLDSFKVLSPSPVSFSSSCMYDDSVKTFYNPSEQNPYRWKRSSYTKCTWTEFDVIETFYECLNNELVLWVDPSEGIKITNYSSSHFNISYQDTIQNIPVTIEESWKSISTNSDTSNTGGNGNGSNVVGTSQVKQFLHQNGGWVMCAAICEKPVDYNSDGIASRDVFAQELNCDKDDIMLYYSNNNIELTEGPTKCNPANPDVYENGTYSLNSTNSEISISFASGNNYHLELIKLTTDTLKIRVNYDTDGDGSSEEVIESYIH